MRVAGPEKKKPDPTQHVKQKWMIKEDFSHFWLWKSISRFERKDVAIILSQSKYVSNISLKGQCHEKSCWTGALRRLFGP